jgi:hypothetical protein
LEVGRLADEDGAQFVESIQKGSQVELIQIPSGAEENESKIAGRTKSFGIYSPLPLRNWESGEDVAGSLMLNKLAAKATTSPADCGGTVS